jgi:hypothetical protein
MSVMQPVFVDIHQLCSFFLSFIFLSPPPTSSSSPSISSLCFSFPYFCFPLHAVILFPTSSHPQFSCVRVSSVSIVNIIWAEWSGNRSSISCRRRDISVHHNQIIFRSHPACCPIDFALFFPGHKATRVEVNHPPASAARMEHRWSYTSLLRTSFHGVVIK